MNTCLKLLLAVSVMAASVSALASAALHTATIDQHGTVVAQSSPMDQIR
ncbi:hypothetical protein ALQ62_03096 [Pseudomonas coronafaciens pv. zizaniae]|nr:hypothetical protein ALQ62_03096 [Pseudomonas coronafaciens pv. zizaniae]